MVLRYILWIFAIYALYRLIFDFIIPVVRVSGQMKKKVREFQNTMEQQNSHAQEPVQHPKGTRQKNGDYIDFEEVKS
jgi:hypothetical protein